MGECFLIQKGDVVEPEPEWDGFYYNEGDEKTDITGGWVTSLTGGTFALTKNTDNLFTSATGNNGLALYRTNNLIDFATINKLKVIINSSGLNSTKRYTFGITPFTTFSTVTAQLLVTTNVTGQEFELDTSAANGSYYIFVGQTNVSSGVTSGAGSANTFKVWGEV